MYDVNKSISCSFTNLACLGNLKIYSLTPCIAGVREYRLSGLMNFRNFFISYVYEVKESIFQRFTNLPYSGDIKNPGQLPL